MGYSMRATYIKAKAKEHVDGKAEDMYKSLALHFLLFRLAGSDCCLVWRLAGLGPKRIRSEVKAAAVTKSPG